MIRAPLSSSYDVLVVGARAAGAATAMLLARAGLRVLAVDRAPEGTDTLSTHALMRAGVLQLHRWGLLRALADAGTPPIGAATFHYGGEAVRVEVKPRDGVDALRAPRRTVLDPLLVRAARDAGARVEHEVALAELIRDGAGRVRGARLELGDGRRAGVDAGLVVGADGLRSRVAALAGAPAERAGRHATAVIYGYWSELEADGYEWFYRPGASAGVIPTDAGQACVFAAMPAGRYRSESSRGMDRLYRDVLAEAAPALAGALSRAHRRGKLRPFPGVPGIMRRPFGDGWALVGDAGSYRDPLTAHGITDALRDAELLARAVVRGGPAALAAYHATRDRAAAAFFELSDRVASFEWSLEELKGLHRALSAEMAAEAELLLALDAEDEARAPRAAYGPSAGR